MSYDEELVEMSPFLRLLPQQAVERIFAKMQRLDFQFGDVIVNEGDAADSYYLLTSGRARVLKLTEAGKEVPLQRLRRGDSFGEIGLLSGGPRTATVRASETTSVLKLDREDFDDVIAEFPQMKEFVQLQLQHRMLQGFLQQYTRFARTPLPVLQRILQFLKPVQYKQGDIIIHQDDPGGSVFIIEQGRLTVYRETDGDKQVLGYLRPGDYFGELSLLQGMRRTATVEAASDCKLHQLAPEDWQAITDEYDELEQLVKERIARYQSDSSADRLPLDFAQAPENARMAEMEEEEETESTAVIERSAATKLKFISQIDEMDCGVAAFAMVCRSFGMDVSPNWIRSETGATTEGTSARGICKVARELGLGAEHVKRSPDQLNSLPTPCMLHVDENHWIALVEAKAGKYRIADPADRIMWIDEDSLRKRWAGHVIVFEYGEPLSVIPQRARQGSWGWLMAIVGTAYWPVLLAVLLMAIVAFGESLVPIFAKQTVDELIPLLTHATNKDLMADATDSIPTIEETVRSLRWRLFGLGGVLVASLILVLLQRRFLSRVSVHIDRMISQHVFSKMLNLPLPYFLNRSVSDLQRRIVGSREIRAFVVNKGIIALHSLAQATVFFAVMVHLNWKLSFGFLVIMLPIYVGLLFFSTKTLRPAYQTLLETEGSFTTLQGEIIDGINTVKASGKEDNFRNLFLRTFHRLNREQLQSQFNIFSFDGTVQALWLVASAFFLWLGARYVLLEQLTAGELVALLILVGMLYAPVVSLVRLWADFQSVDLQLRRLNEVLEWPPEQDSRSSKLKPASSIQGRVEFRDVSVHFGSEESEAALNGVTFSASPGQLIVIVGRSGAGKTVFAETVASLLPPSQGAILYDGVPSTDVILNDLRRQIGYVMKDTHIFTGSVAFNIGFGEIEPDQDRIVDAARKVGIHDAIQKLPDGYDTIIWDRDHRLSEAMRQGISFARALYNDPAIMVLDEINGPLEVEGEVSLLDAYEHVFRGRTVFLITRQVALAQNADLILVLDRGRVVEQGTHDNLMTRRGVYYHLANH